MNTETAIPQTAETAKIARRNDKATVVWLTCGIASRKNTVIPTTISRASKLRIVRRRTDRVMCIILSHQTSSPRSERSSDQEARRLAGSSVAAEKSRGNFKLFLGYAPGVGKTFAMLSEAIRRHSRGEDVVIGVVETHGRKGIEELVTQLEAVPRKKIEYKGTLFEEMDLDGILARKPAVVLVDELAHTNIPGSKNRKRYEDVQALLAAKIDVISTLNIQHIESISPVVRNITGINDPRNRAGLGAHDRQRNGHGRPDARSAAKPHETRRRVHADKSGTGTE